jgi:hypothetical protein
LNLSTDCILKIVKPIYDVLEIEAHWFRIYHDHHVKNLEMQQSTFDSCLLNATEDHFDLVDLQTDDSLILANSNFAASKEFHLQKAKLMTKERKKLTCHANQ